MAFCHCCGLCTLNSILMPLKLGIHWGMRQAEVCQICLHMLVYVAHHVMANCLGLPHALCGPIHWLLVHQNESQLSMPTMTCLYMLNACSYMSNV